MKNLYKQSLFCPGPVNVAENVKAAVYNEIGHRESEFSKLLNSIHEKLLTLFLVENKKQYASAVITGSGTAANEAVLSSIVGNKNILIISNGEFGERLAEISRLHNQNTFHLRFDWAKSFNLPKIEKFLEQNPADVIAMVHHETSTGMLNPVEEIGLLATKFNLTFFVDAVSSAGAEKIEIEKLNISFVTTSASKALCSIPGISIVVGKKQEFEKLKNIPPKTAYLNLYKFYYFAKHYEQTPNTPAVQSFFALNQALDNIISEGVENHLEKINKLTKVCRKGLRKMGLKFLVRKKEEMSSFLTSVISPVHVNVEILKALLKTKGIIVYDGKGPFKNKTFQVGTIGNLAEEDIRLFLENLSEALESFNVTNSPLIQKMAKNTNILAKPIVISHNHLTRQYKIH